MSDPYAARAEKLVRDRIPDLIRRSGRAPDVRPARPGEMLTLLQAKLREEADEFSADPGVAELADLLEVVRAMAAHVRVPWPDVEAECAAKAAERGGFAEGHVLHLEELPGRPLVQKARALLLDGEELLLLRRTRPGRDPYWTTPGGRVEPDDADVPAALRRELHEELGATIGPPVLVYTFAEQRLTADYRHHFFACRLETMDLALRHGPEFDDPGRGGYDVDRFPCRPEAFSELPLWPREIRDHLVAQVTTLPVLV